MRSEAARTAILTATSSLIERLGYDRVTIEGIASEAGVGKQTIYRWWPSKSAVVAECLLEGALIPETFEPQDTGDLAADLSEWLERALGFVSTHHSLLHSLIGAAVENEEVGQRLYERLGASPEVLAERLRVAQAAGQLRAGVSVEQLVDAIVGMLIARLLFGAPIRSDDAHGFIDLILHGATPNRPQ